MRTLSDCTAVHRSLTVLLSLIFCLQAVQVNGQTPVPATYGCYPTSGQTSTADPLCTNGAGYEEIKIGQARVAGFNNNPAIDIVIPANRPEWAIATYHYYLMMRNYFGRPVDIHWLLALGMKESVLACDPNVTYPPFIAGYSITNGPLNTAENSYTNGNTAINTLVVQDGCFQTDPSGLAALGAVASPGSMPWRWNRPGTLVTNTGHGTLIGSAYIDSRFSGSRNFVYGMFAVAQYMAQNNARVAQNQGINAPMVTLQAQDPFALELAYSRTYNKGQWDNASTVMFGSAGAINTFLTRPRIQPYYFGATGTIELNYAYTAQIENALNVLNQRPATITTNPPVWGTPVNQFFDYYDRLLTWTDFEYYIDVLISPQTAVTNPGNQIPGGIILPFFEGINVTTFKAKVKAVFDNAALYSAQRRGVAFDGKVSFRYDAKPVIEAIVYGLPSDNPPITCNTCTGVATKITATGTDLCSAVTLTASPINAGQRYQWFLNGVAISNANGGWNSSLTATTAGSYELEITTSGNCTTRSRCAVTLTACTPLAVQWLTFTARQHQQSSVSLSWSGLFDEDGDFYVERSTYGLHFTAIGTVARRGNASTFNFEDYHPETVAAYYRIKWVDPNETSYSAIRYINPSATADYLIKPNPFTTALALSNLSSQTFSYLVLDVNGRELLHGQIEAGEEIQLGTALEAGLYLLQIRTAEGIYTEKIIKQ